MSKELAALKRVVEWFEIENVKDIEIIERGLKVLEILKAFDFEIEDYTKDKNGSIKVNYNRIILDSDEIDVAKEVLL